MKRSLGVTATLATVVLLGLSGCGGSATPVTVTAQNLQFAPKTIEVSAGQPVKLTLRNPDSVEHDLQVDHFPMKLTATEMKHLHSEMADMPGMDMAGGMDMLHIHGKVGETDVLTFTPTKPGTYTIYCAVPGHKEAGMTATLVVK
jgi:uncharacterized cupredoxin-like copper-binding protein